MFENLDEYIDPVIDPVLEKNFVPNASGGPACLMRGCSDGGFSLRRQV